MIIVALRKVPENCIYRSALQRAGQTEHGNAHVPRKRPSGEKQSVSTANSKPQRLSCHGDPQLPR